MFIHGVTTILFLLLKVWFFFPTNSLKYVYFSSTKNENKIKDHKNLTFLYETAETKFNYITRSISFRLVEITIGFGIIKKKIVEKGFCKYFV